MMPFMQSRVTCSLRHVTRTTEARRHGASSGMPVPLSSTGISKSPPCLCASVACTWTRLIAMIRDYSCRYLHIRRRCAGHGDAQSDHISRSHAARAHASRAERARHAVDQEALRHAARAVDDARGDRHVDHPDARIQRRPGVRVDVAAHLLRIAAPHHPRLLQPRRRQAGRALLDRPLRLRRPLHDGADAERRPARRACASSSTRRTRR